MPHVHITMLEGRGIEKKRKIVERITQVMTEETGAPPAAVTITFVELPKECLASAGVLMCDRK